MARQLSPGRWASERQGQLNRGRQELLGLLAHLRPWKTPLSHVSLSGMGCVCAEHTLPPPDSMCHVSANLYQDNRTGVVKLVKVAAFFLLSQKQC